MIRISRFLLLLLLVFFILNNLSAQKPKHIIDSLLIVLQTAKQDTNRVNIYNTLSFFYGNYLSNYPQSILYADSALALSDKLNFRKGKALAYRAKGNISNYFGNNAEALKNFRESLIVSQEIGDKKGVLTALGGIAEVYRRQGDYTKALENYETSLKIAREINDKAGIARALNYIGIIYTAQGKYSEASEKIQTALKIQKEIGDRSGIANSLINLGIINDDLGNYPEAIKNYQAAMKIHEELGNKRGVATCLNNIGIIYDYQGNYKESLKNYLTALKVYQDINDKNGAANALMNISYVYGMQKNEDEAIKYQLESLKLFQEIGDKDRVALCYNNLGNIYIGQCDYEQALKNEQQALKLFQEVGDQDGICLSNFNLGQIYENQKNFSESLKCYLVSLEIYERTQSKRGIADANVHIGTLLYKQAAAENDLVAKQRLNESIQYLNKGLKLAQQIGAPGTARDAYESLTEANKSLKDYEKALAYHKLYMQLKDSLQNNEITRKMEQQRTEFEVEKAVAAEKVETEKQMAEQNSSNEKKLAEEKLNKEKAIEIEKLKYQFALTTEKTKQEQILAQEKFNNEKALAEENTRHQQAMMQQKLLQEKKDATFKAAREKEATDRKRKNEMFLIGFGIVALVSFFAILLFRQRTQKRRAVEKAQTLHKMAELELQSLRAQLNPHFMFNSLNAIQDLIVNEDNNRSHLYLSRFSKLLRMLLDNANQPFVTVKQEMDFLELYLSLENLRIPDLQISIEKDPNIDTEKRMIPNMMLQPYIENAIWHGLSNKKGNRKLQIRIHDNGLATEFEIEDNGVGRKKATEIKQQFRGGHHSKGMELLSKRFNLLSKEYGAAIHTTVTDLQNNGDAAGTLVKIDVPFTLSSQAKNLIHDTNHYN